MTSIEFIEFSEILKYFFRIPVLYKKKKSTEYKFINQNPYPETALLCCVSILQQQEEILEGKNQ